MAYKTQHKGSFSEPALFDKFQCFHVRSLFCTNQRGKTGTAPPTFQPQPAELGMQLCGRPLLMDTQIGDGYGDNLMGKIHILSQIGCAKIAVLIFKQL